MMIVAFVYGGNMHYGVYAADLRPAPLKTTGLFVDRTLFVCNFAFSWVI